MSKPKRIEDITVLDLKSHRWCYLNDDEGGYDAFEYVVPDSHEQFDENVLELELAVFKFNGDREYFGMYDGSKSYSIYLDNEWFSFWHGVRKPTESEIAHFKDTLLASNLAFPVSARAYWSGQTELFRGIRYYDERGIEIELEI
ncbi:hypothetical protein [Undibacterium danionis]|uniref:Uncharacterized protein n=1 Tax=Undibacterium danionis TaxID=1812100 RepID=A0ABV6I8R9_9BURK